MFDIHPPLGKLVLLAVGKVFGYDHTKCTYNAIQDMYGPGCKYYVLRAAAATFGSLTAPLYYWIIRGFGGGVWAATLGASFFLFDNLNLLGERQGRGHPVSSYDTHAPPHPPPTPSPSPESRLVLIDSQLIFWCAASLALALKWWSRIREDCEARESWNSLTDHDIAVVGVNAVRAVGYDSKGFPKAIQTDSELTKETLKRDLAAMLGTSERNLWCLVLGVATSSAISIKWTGLATPGMIGMESFFGFFFLRR